MMVAAVMDRLVHYGGMVVERRVDFFVAGAQKAGTTALHRMLLQHPGIDMGSRKEAHFFDNEALNWTAPDHEALHGLYDWRRPVLRGEATPITLFWPNALERLHAYNPAARIVVLLRHPSFRAFSQWRMERQRRSEPLEFAEAIRGGRARVTATEADLRSKSYVERGFYDDQIDRVLALFPRRSVHFVRSDRMLATPAPALSALFEFLIVEDCSSDIVGHYVSPVSYDGADALAASDRAYLDELFAPHIARTALLTGLDFSDWLAPDYREPTAL